MTPKSHLLKSRTEAPSTPVWAINFLRDMGFIISQIIDNVYRSIHCFIANVTKMILRLHLSEKQCAWMKMADNTDLWKAG
jgi:hypothetical protein